MKRCPECNSEVDDNFDLCWNCRYSFIDEKVLKSDAFILICPRCNLDIKSSFNYCPYCQYDLRTINEEIGSKPQELRKIDCIRCKVPLDFQGNYKFHQASLIGPITNLVNGFIYRESFDFYCCPSCGKVEFFLPGGD